MSLARQILALLAAKSCVELVLSGRWLREDCWEARADSFGIPGIGRGDHVGPLRLVDRRRKRDFLMLTKCLRARKYPEPMRGPFIDLPITMNGTTIVLLRQITNLKTGVHSFKNISF